MKKLQAHFLKILAATGMLSLMQAQTSHTFTFTGAVQTFTVPSCVTSITIDALGSQGGINAAMTTTGGLGGQASGVLAVTPGDVLYIYVGGMNGFNGGGSPGTSACTQAEAGYGGGASDVRLNGTALTDRVLVGAGGGGGGGDRISTCGRGTGGGGGGGYYGGGGGAGYPSSSMVVPTGGTQTSGGVGGTSSFSSSQNGQPGTLGFGGNGGGELSSNQAGGNTALPGGAGGGLTGTNGQVQTPTVYTGHSGAGGSSYTGGVSSGSTTTGVRSGNGVITFSYVIGGGILQTTLAHPMGICPGGTTSISAANVNTFTWSTGSNASSITVSPGATTSYTVLGTNSQNCISKHVVTVVVNPEPVIAPVSSHSFICVGGSVTFTATGASTYTWQGGSNAVSITVSPSVSTVYSVSGTSTAGCVSSGTVMANVNTNTLTVSSNTSMCIGSSLTLTASGGTVYSWSTGSPFHIINISPTTNTFYTVNATDQFGCPLSGAVSVTVNSLPNVFISSTRTVICKYEALVLNGNGANTYSWSTGSSASSIVITPTIDVAFTFNVTGTDQNGCSKKASLTISVKNCPGIAEHAAAKTEIYPNPTSGGIRIVAPPAMHAELAKVVDASGRLVAEARFTAGELFIDLSGAAAGGFFVQVYNGDGLADTQRIIKEQ